jgi:hypothetical protein
VDAVRPGRRAMLLDLKQRYCCSRSLTDLIALGTRLTVATEARAGPVATQAPDSVTTIRGTSYLGNWNVRMKIASNIMKAVNLCLVLAARASTSAQCRRLGWTHSDLFRRLGTYSWEKGT